MQTLRAAGDAGLTLAEVCVNAKGLLGDWPAAKDMETRSMSCGHLQQLADAGLVRTVEGRPVRYVALGQWLGIR